MLLRQGRLYLRFINNIPTEIFYVDEDIRSAAEPFHMQRVLTIHQTFSAEVSFGIRQEMPVRDGNFIEYTHLQPAQLKAFFVNWWTRTTATTQSEWIDTLRRISNEGGILLEEEAEFLQKTYEELYGTEEE